MSKGFTLIEAMVSSLLVAGMTLGVFYLISRSSETRVADEARIKLVQTSRLVEAKLKQDLSQAVRPTGSARLSFAGVSRLKAYGSSYPEGLVIIVEKFGQFSTPSRVTLEPDGQVALQIQVSGTDLQAQYIQEALRRRSLFLISSAEYSNIFSVDDNLQPGAVRTLTNNKLVLPSNFAHMIREHANMTSSIRTLEVVLWYMSDGQLIREVRTNLPGRTNSYQTSRQVMAENVSNFDLDYSFEDRRRANKIVPEQRLQKVSDYYTSEGCTPAPGIICCDESQLEAGKCVDMNDVRDVRASLVLLHEDSRIKSHPPTNDGFIMLNGLMRYSKEMRILPLRYGAGFGAIGLVGQRMDCALNDPGSRCNPNCIGENGPFHNRTLLPDGSYPLDWWEYGDMNSNACQCYTLKGQIESKNFTQSAVPFYDPNGGANQPIEYCAKHFPGCSAPGGETWIMSRYPPAYLSCWCMAPRPGNWQTPNAAHYNRDLNTSSPTYAEYRYNIPRDLTAANHILGGIISDPENEDNQLCYIWTGCDAQAARWFTNLPTPTPWKDKCKCVLENVSNDGTFYGGAHRNIVNYNDICNADYLQNISASPSCPNTVDTSTRKLRLASASHRNALNEQDAKFCACYNNGGFNSNNNPSGSGGNLDFRVGSPIQDPLLPNGSVPLQSSNGQPATLFGALQSQAVVTEGVRIENGVTTTVPISGTCDRVNCDQLHHAGINFGCCTANRPIQWTVPVLQQRPALTGMLNGAHGNYLAWASYCSPECINGRNVNVNGQNVAEIQRIREIITNTARGGTVPAICGSFDYFGTGGN